jgi:hypothetical protein
VHLGKERKQHIVIPVDEPVPDFIEVPDEPRRVGFEPDEPAKVPVP